MASKLKDQQAISPTLLIILAGVGVAAVAFFIVNMIMGGGGGSDSSSAQQVVQPAVSPLPNLNIPTAPPPPPGSGRDPFQAVAGAGATPAPVATAAPAPAGVTPRERAREAIETPAPSGEFQSTAGDRAYVEVISVSADRRTAQIRNGTIVYEQARPGQTLDRGVVVDSIDANRCVHVHRGSGRQVLCAGNRALM